MAKHLVIVESPAKARTIRGFLGADYDVQASIGHIRDLAENKAELPKEFQGKWWADYSVDLDNNFEPKYVVPREKAEQVRRLKAALQGASSLVLATDEDREGESISWHLLEVLKPKKTISVKRIAFHEITKEAIKKALDSPRDVDEHLVRAQEARRILDRLYGYTLSPVLWRLGKGRGLSAGRVQTPAVKLVVERELERRRFARATYWDLLAKFAAEKEAFEAGLTELDGKRVAQGRDFDPTTGTLSTKDAVVVDEETANALAEAAKSATTGKVLSVEERPEIRKPYAPFMTSTLQQEANRKLGFAADRTMRVAQALYEGIDGSGFDGGLITYMRTDSLALSSTAVGQARDLIGSRYGKEYLPDKPNRFASKVHNAQEAHEAIRPTDVGRTPEMVANALAKLSGFTDHVKLYELIWKRTVASQMRAAELQMTTAKIGLEAGNRNLVFSASGKSIKFPGFLRAYVEGSDDPEAALEDQEKLLPALKKDQQVSLQDVQSKRHDTRPPSRYTDATLIKALEERGIGRPSTYAATIKTIVDRDYVRKAGKELVPTFMAFLVTEVLDKHFAEFADLNFTARMDDSLDDISKGEVDWREYLKAFFFGKNGTPGLKPLVDERSGNIRRPVFEVGNDPESGEPITVQFGRNGFFLARGEGEGAATATVPEDQPPADLDVAKALELLATKAGGGASVGVHPATGRRLLLKQKGGYYLEVERTPEEIAAKEKPTWVSLPPGIKPDELTQEVLNDLCSLPRTVGKHPDSGAAVLVKMGKYGAYAECGVERRTIENWREALTIDLPTVVALLAAPKAGRAARAAAGPLAEFGEQPGCAGPVKILAGRFGPYVTDGTTNATLPKGLDPLAVSVEQALELLAKKREAGPAPKKRFVKKKRKG